MITFQFHVLLTPFFVATNNGLNHCFIKLVINLLIRISTNEVKMSHFNNHTTMRNKNRSILGKDCPSLVSIALIKTMAKSNFWRVYVSMQLIVHHKGKSGKILKVGTWVQELKQKSWKVLLYCLPSLLSCTLQGHLFRDGTVPRGLSPSTSLMKKMPYRLTIRHYDGWRHCTN